MFPTAIRALRAYVDTPNGQVHYYDTGGSGCPLLLLHQSPGSSVDYANAFPALRAAGLRLIAIDAPGMGLSDAPPHETRPEDFVAAVLAVLDHAGLEEVDVLGHHTGAQVAAEAAAQRPDRFRNVVLYGAPFLSEAQRKALWDQMVPREREGLVHRPVAGGANLFDQYARLEGHFGPVTAQHFLLSTLIAGPKGWYGHNCALQWDIAPALRVLRQPTLLLTHRDDFLRDATIAAKAFKPEAELVIMDIEGGVAMDAAPEALAAAVVKFLRD